MARRVFQYLVMLHDIVKKEILELGRDLNMAVWGWHTFIEEIQDFLSRADREIGKASAYAHYVIERLEICVQALSNVLQHLNKLAVNEEIAQEIREIRTAVHEIRNSCIVLHGIWQSRMDEIEQLASMSASYEVPTINREGRGRPQLLRNS